MMKAVIERVADAAVVADGKEMGSSGAGLLVFVGVGQDDTEKDAAALASKIAKMRIFEDEQGKMGKALADIDGTLYVISNFTLYADCKKGNRPDFFKAASPEKAKALYEHFVDCLRPLVPHMICGVFGADMKINATCDGPVTVVLESENLKKD